MRNMSTILKGSLVCFLLVVAHVHAQQGIAYTWEPQNSYGNWGNGVNWSPYGRPDSLDFARVWNGQHSSTTVGVEDSFAVGILLFISGRIEGISLDVLDSLRWYGGELGGNIEVTIPDTGFGVIQAYDTGVDLDDNAQLINNGKLYWYGGDIGFSGTGSPLLTNRDTFHIVTKYTDELKMYSNFKNESGGVVIKSSPAPVRFKNWFNSFYSYGHIDVRAGLFDVSVPGIVSGSVAVSDSGEFYISSTNQITLSDIDISGPGKVTFGRTINSNYITLSGDNYIDKLYMEGPELGGTGTLTIRDSMRVNVRSSLYNRIVTIMPQAVLRLDEELNNLNSNGNVLDTLYLLGRAEFSTKGSFGGSKNGIILNRGVMDVKGDKSKYVISSSRLIHDSTGIINIDVPAGEYATFYAIDGYGDVYLKSGTMRIRDEMTVYSGIWDLAPGTTVYTSNALWGGSSLLLARGTIQAASGVLRFNGDLMPGGKDPGRLTLIPNRDVDFWGNSRLIIQLGGNTPGTEYDRIDVTERVSYGRLNLNGTLDVRLVNDFAPAPGDIFVVIRHLNGYSGAFSDTLLPELPDPGLRLELMQTDTTLSLVVSGTPTGIENGGEEENLPRHFALEQNYPNPFNPQTTIRYALPRAAKVTLEIFDMLGQRVATPVKGVQRPGVHSVRWEAGNQPSGVYIYRLRAGKFMETKKMILLR